MQPKEISLRLILLTVLVASAISFVYVFQNTNKSPVAEIVSYIPAPVTQLAQLSGTGSGLVGWWKLDEGTGITAADSSGTGNNGTLVGSTLPTWTTGHDQVGKAVQFSYVTAQGIVLKDSASLNPAKITVAFWVKIPDTSSTFRIFNKTNEFIIRASRGTMQMIKGAFFDSTVNYQANTWEHWVFTGDTDYRWYRNGVLAGVSPTAWTATPGGNDIQISGSLDQFTGTIDEVRIYSRALSANEVAAIYQADSGVTVVSNPPANGGSTTTTSSTVTNPPPVEPPPVSPPVTSNTYYVDYVNGLDTNSGTTQTTPWKHAPGDNRATSNAANVKLKPGNTVIFKGGVTYSGSVSNRGTIQVLAEGTAGNPITYEGNSGWGSGKAIIDGGDYFQTSWTRCPSAAACGNNPNWNNIYYADAPATFTSFEQGVFEDGHFMWYAQNPIIADPFYWDLVTSWIKIPMNSTTIIETNSTITDPNVFTQSDPNYWVGTTIGIWVNPNGQWLTKITSYNPATHTVTFPTLVAPNLPYPGDQYDNYYSLFNHLSLLKKPGYYSLDEANHRLYIWPSNSDNPASHKYSLGVQNMAFYNYGSSYVTINGFSIQHFVLGINAPKTIPIMTNLIISNNDISNLMSNDWYAISMTADNSVIKNNNITNGMRSIAILFGGNNIKIDHNFVSRTSRQGLWCMGANNVQITNNTVIDINGQHSNGISAYAGCDDTLIANNVVTDNILPITFGGSKNLTLYNNVVDNGFVDGGIHNWGGMTGNVVVVNNTITRGMRGSSGGALALSVNSPTANFTVLNNIIDGGGNTAGIHDYNIYNSLAWYQQTNNGWTMGIHESVQSDISKIFVNPSALDFHLLSGNSAVGGGVNARQYLPISTFPDFNFMTDVAGTPRSSTGAWSIGAYESGSGGNTGGQTSANYNPADTTQDWRINLSEIQAYALCWKTSGCIWSVGPNPILQTYLNIAAHIYRTGEVYHYDGNKNCPGCYVKGQ